MTDPSIFKRIKNYIHMWLAERNLVDFPKRENPVEKPVMAPEDAYYIHALALGWDTFRDEAIEVHKRYISTLGVRGTPEMCFMAEVDNVCPDSNLREIYRKQILRANMLE